MRRSNIIFVVICVVYVYGMGIWTLLRPHSDFSEEENRALAVFPRISSNSFWNGELLWDTSDFFCDQFPLRRNFTNIKAVCEQALVRHENNGVIFGKDGYLMISPKYEDLSLYKKNLGEIGAFCEKYRERGIDTEVFFAPRGVDVLDGYLPDIYSNSDAERTWGQAREALPYLIDANFEIKSRADAGEYVWYRTDHHWTSRGAYEGYLRICDALGEAPYEINSFEEDVVSGEFYGSVYSKAGVLRADSDEVEILRPSESLRVVNYDSGESFEGIYRLEKCDSKNKYEVFLGGNYGHIGIYSEDEGKERETVLLIKDSFANCAIQFLAETYDIEVYDLRYFEGKLGEEISRIAPDKILILYGIDTVVTDGSLSLLRR